MEAGAARTRTSESSANPNSTEKQDSAAVTTWLSLEQPKPFVCLFCPRAFNSSQALGGHQNAHRRERQQVLRVYTESQLNACSAGNTVPPSGCLQATQKKEKQVRGCPNYPNCCDTSCDHSPGGTSSGMAASPSTPPLDLELKL